MKSRFRSIATICIVLLNTVKVLNGIPFPFLESMLDHDDDTRTNFDGGTTDLMSKSGLSGSSSNNYSASDETFLPTARDIDADLEKPTVAPVSDSLTNVQKEVQLQDTNISATEIDMPNQIKDINLTTSSREVNTSINTTIKWSDAEAEPTISSSESKMTESSKEELIPSAIPGFDGSQNSSVQNLSTNPPSIIQLPPKPPKSNLSEVTETSLERPFLNIGSSENAQEEEIALVSMQDRNLSATSESPTTNSYSFNSTPKVIRLDLPTTKQSAGPEITSTVQPSVKDQQKSNEEIPETETETTTVRSMAGPILTTPVSVLVENDTVKNSSRIIPKTFRLNPRKSTTSTASPKIIDTTTTTTMEPSTSSASTDSFDEALTKRPDPRDLTVTMPMPGFNRLCNSYFDCGFRPVANGSRTWLRCVGNFCACELLGYIRDEEADWDITWNHQAEACLADINGPCGYSKGIEIHCNIGYQCLDHVCDRTGRIRVRNEVRTTPPPISSCDDAYTGLNICETETKNRINIFSVLLFPSVNIFESILNNSLINIKQFN